MCLQHSEREVKGLREDTGPHRTVQATAWSSDFIPGARGSHQRDKRQNDTVWCTQSLTQSLAHTSGSTKGHGARERIDSNPASTRRETAGFAQGNVRPQPPPRRTNNSASSKCTFTPLCPRGTRSRRNPQARRDSNFSDHYQMPLFRKAQKIAFAQSNIYEMTLRRNEGMRKLRSEATVVPLRGERGTAKKAAMSPPSVPEPRCSDL